MAADPSVTGTLDDDGTFTETPIEDASTDGAPYRERWAGSGSGPASGGPAASEPHARRQAFETRAAAADPARRRARAERMRRAPSASRSAGAPPASASAERPAPAGRQTRHAHRIGETRPASSRTDFGLPTRDWLGGSADDPIRRLGLALVAWPPLGLAAAAAIGDLTGCSSFAATCGGTDALLPWLAQAGILGLLLLLPALARLLAAGSIAVVLALVPATAFLVVIGGSGEPQAGFALGFLLAIAWLAGLGWYVVTAHRRHASRDARGIT
jgi:hypothetical protein